jgi:hypothetical protein
MADPNSRLTQLRAFLAAVLEPKPDPGEAWCMDCVLNGGRTMVLSADGTKAHAAEHKSAIEAIDGPLTAPLKVVMKTRWKIT